MLIWQDDLTSADPQRWRGGQVVSDQYRVTRVYTGKDVWYDAEVASKAWGGWYPFSRALATLEAAQAECDDHAQDQIALAALPRPELIRPEWLSCTPWGKPDHAVRYGTGIVFYSTPSHGGFKVTPTLNRKMPDHLRLADGWYEEDCDWCRVALAFPALFTARERRHAQQTAEWAASYGIPTCARLTAAAGA